MTKIITIKTNTAFNVDFSANGTSYRLEIRYNAFSDSYYFNLIRLMGMKLLLSGITVSTGTNMLSQFSWFKLWFCPTKPELYAFNPTSKTIKDFQIWVEDEE
jgi:hypothetical protein|nr:MAG TPA: hypothetical protein [Caudoviricetes sp.]